MQENKKHIVLVSTWLPPRSGVAVSRMAAFVKYLQPKFRITVITTREGLEPEEEILLGARFIRVRNRSFLPALRERAGEPRPVHLAKVLWNVCVRALRHSDYSGWMTGAVEKLRQIHAQDKIDAVISSYAPPEAHRAALLFASQHPEVRWVADMRDEMTGNPHVPARLSRALETLERGIAARADAVTTVSAPLVQEFTRKMPGVKYFEEVRNGFDHDISAALHFNPVFTIAYAGTFYGSNKPDLFFEALRQFREKHGEKVALWFIGTHRNFDVPESFRKDTLFYPVLPNEDAVRLMARADATLLTLAPVKRKGVYTGKLFDYLSVKRPVIAIVDPAGSAADLIRELGAGFVAGYDAAEAEAAITAAWTMWKERRPLAVDDLRISRLHRRYAVEKMQHLLERILAT